MIRSQTKSIPSLCRREGSAALIKGSNENKKPVASKPCNGKEICNKPIY